MVTYAGADKESGQFSWARSAVLTTTVLVSQSEPAASLC
uniref:Uncharacterized protein n=1 Tax=Pseudomonas aeruginosa TaxID=287 RepID=A0A7S5YBM7_PSEAI|nr:hypothetical protein [Pseudomonas aeruginosa]